MAGSWVVVCRSDELGELPKRVLVDDREIVVWRVPGGDRIAALDDRCAHQWVRLSIGTIRDDGCLVCVSHGWTYAPDGTNALIPGGQGVTAHEADERDGAVLVRLRPLGQ